MIFKKKTSPPNGHQRITEQVNSYERVKNNFKTSRNVDINLTKNSKIALTIKK